MSDPDIRRVLDFWFQPGTMDQPTIDSRMDRWFTTDAVTDAVIRTEFGPMVEKASQGLLDGWAAMPEGRLALILLLDQFRRHIYRGTRKAFSRDPQALKFCVEGAMKGEYKSLTPFQQAFFFMPLQHAESLKIQERSVKIYQGLVNGVSDTLKATFATFAQFAELHHDIIESLRSLSPSQQDPGPPQHGRGSGVPRLRRPALRPVSRCAITGGVFPCTTSHRGASRSSAAGAFHSAAPTPATCGQSNQDMMTAALQALVDAFSLSGERLGDVSLGAVMKHSRDWNLARECVLGTALAPETPAFDLQRACGTSLEAAILIGNKIALGQIDSGIAAGTDTISDVPIVYPDEYARDPAGQRPGRSFSARSNPGWACARRCSSPWCRA